MPNCTPRFFEVLGAVCYKGTGFNPDNVKETSIVRFGGYTFVSDGKTHSLYYGLCLTLWCPVIDNKNNVYMAQIMMELGSGERFYRYATRNPLPSDWTWNDAQWHDL